MLWKNSCLTLFRSFIHIWNLMLFLKIGSPLVAFSSIKTTFLLRSWAMLFIDLSVDSVIPHTLVKRFVISPQVLLSIRGCLSALVLGLNHLVKVGFGNIVVKPSIVFAIKTFLFCMFLRKSILKFVKVYTFISSTKILIVWTRLLPLIFLVKRMLC